ncbi:MAG: PEP-CTERM sorting domain-containing protein [Verrucomicrobiaceae bacterium]|nr:MAG: PEP-CTERM sorting domain-containing protein [Verrucomicrobiaceae bacterium]
MNSRSPLPSLARGFLFVSLGSSTAYSAVVDFTAGENYIAGSLDKDTPGQSQAWDFTSSTNSNRFIVNPPGLTLTNANSGQAVYQTPQDYGQGSITTYIDFAFSQTAGSATTAANVNVVGVQYLQNPTSDNLNSMVAVFGRSSVSATPYRLTMGGVTAVSFDETNLGINFAGNDLTSDPLRLSVTITRLATMDMWTRTTTLTNLTTSATVAQIVSGGFTSFSTSSVPSVWTDSTLYASMQNYAAAATQLDALSIRSFGVIQVPEPGVLTSLGAGALLLLKRRRR